MIEVSLDHAGLVAGVPSPVTLRLRNGASGRCSEVRLDLRAPRGMSIVRGSRRVEVRRLDAGASHDHAMIISIETAGEHVLQIRRLEYLDAQGVVRRTSDELAVLVDNPPPTPPATPRRRPGSIFISYRHDDTGRVVDHLGPALRNAFPDRVFHDHSSLRPGERWSRRIVRELRESAVLLAVVGPSWLKAETEDGRRRLEDEDDWVRRELTTALDLRLDVVPVLVDGAPPPRESQLPPPLRRMCEHEAYRLLPGERCADALIEVLRHLLGDAR